MCLFKQYLCVLCPLLTQWGGDLNFAYVYMLNNQTGSMSIFSLLSIPGTLLNFVYLHNGELFGCLKDLNSRHLMVAKLYDAA